MKKRLRLTLLASFLSFACSSPDRKNSKPYLAYPQQLQVVRDLISDNKTHDARMQIEDYLNRAENIHWYGHAYFLKGFIYEKEGQVDMAIKAYLSAVEHGSQYENAIEARALYNLSFVYESQDRRDELLATLIDLMKRRQYFVSLTGQVEIPARLAALYAAQGKMKEALIFHREASENFKKMVRQRENWGPKGELSKSLHYLGLVVFDGHNENFNDLIRKLEVGQKYFLAAAEASKGEWSEKSVERLKQLYDKAWGLVLEYEPKNLVGDSMAATKQKHRRQLVMASQFYDLMFRLQAEEFPIGQVNPRSATIMRVASQWIDRIEKFALSLRVGPETIRSESIKNRPLARYVEEESQKVLANKEVSAIKPPPKPDTSGDPEEKVLRSKQGIGKDPNL
jgi:tetratricopeptide (TPR) repeat protein